MYIAGQSYKQGAEAGLFGTIIGIASVLKKSATGEYNIKQKLDKQTSTAAHNINPAQARKVNPAGARNEAAVINLHSKNAA